MSFIASNVMLSRTCNMQAKTLSTLSLRRFSETAQRLYAQRATCSTLETKTVLGLHARIKDAECPQTQRLLLNLKRSIYNGANYLAIINKNIDRLKDYPEIIILQRAKNRLLDLETEVKEHFCSGYSEILKTYKNLLENGDFCSSIILASNQFLDTMPKDFYEAEINKRTKKHKHFEDTLASFIYRSCLRTTPFAKFSSVEFHLLGSKEKHALPLGKSVLSINSALCNTAMEALYCSNDFLYTNRFFGNPTCSWDGKTLIYYNRSKILVTTKVPDKLKNVIACILEAFSGKSQELKNISQVLAIELGVELSVIRDLILKLARLGVLCHEDDYLAGSNNWVEALRAKIAKIKALDAGKIQKVEGLLADTQSFSEGYKETTKERKVERFQQLSDAWSELSGSGNHGPHSP